MSARKISIGFLRPSKLEQDIIYIQLVKEPEKIYAEAISKKDFNYITYPIIGNEVKRRGKHADNLYGSLCRRDMESHNDFIMMLRKMNDIGNIENRYEEDGLILSRQSGIAREMSKELEKVISLSRDIKANLNVTTRRLPKVPSFLVEKLNY